MCGIAGVHIKNPKLVKHHSGLEEFVDQLFLGIEERGTHATGFVAVTREGKVVVDKAPIAASDFIGEREKIPVGAQTILLHTRFQTQGDSKIHGNNHPVIHKTCFAVHNGGIWNDDSLFKKHDLKRSFEVDSEIIPALLYKYGLEDKDAISEALKELIGSFAFAAIDPIRSPKKLLLVKGMGSPLIVFENDNVVMWASTVRALREAWGKVMGTPPGWTKFEHLIQGDYLLYNDTEKEKGRFSTHSNFHGPRHGSGYSTTWTRRTIPQIINNSRNRGRGTGAQTGVRKPWDGAFFANERDFKDSVKELRHLGRGTARLWHLRDQYDIDKDFKDLDGGIQWVDCICGSVVCIGDVRKHVTYGQMCVDCYDTIITRYRQKAVAQNKPPDSVDAVHAIPEKDKINLEKWAELECKLHDLTILALEERTGYSAAAIDFLLYRAAAPDFGSGMSKLKQDLIKLYEQVREEAYTENWHEITGTKKINEQREVEKEAQDEADENFLPWYSYSTPNKLGQLEVWYVCLEHGDQFEYGDACDSCNAEITPTPKNPWPHHSGRNIGKFQCFECADHFSRDKVTQTSDGAYICDTCKYSEADSCGVVVFNNKKDVQNGLWSNIERCNQCRGYKNREQPCPHCKKEEITEEEVSKVEPKALPPANLVCICPTARGKQCKRRVAYITQNEDNVVTAYCANHYRYCSKKKCNDKANHTLPDGRRLCHRDARKTAATADTQAFREGTTLVEIPNK